MRLLIVENDDRIVGFMKRGLEAEAHQVDVASGKAQTLALTTAQAYDIIILDIFLRPDDGLEICQTLRQRHVKSPILIITAKGTTEIQKASEAAGANAYLPKPFAFEELVATMTRLHTSHTPSDSPKEVLLQTGADQDTTERLRNPTRSVK